MIVVIFPRIFGILSSWFFSLFFAFFRSILMIYGLALMLWEFLFFATDNNRSCTICMSYLCMPSTSMDILPLLVLGVPSSMSPLISCMSQTMPCETPIADAGGRELRRALWAYRQGLMRHFLMFSNANVETDMLFMKDKKRTRLFELVRKRKEKNTKLRLHFVAHYFPESVA